MVRREEKRGEVERKLVRFENENDEQADTETSIMVNDPRVSMYCVLRVCRPAHLAVDRRVV